MKLITFILHQIMCPFWLQLVHSCYRKLVHCKLPITLRLMTARKLHLIESLADHESPVLAYITVL